MIYTLESHPTLTTVFRLRVVNLSANDLMLGGAHAILSSVDEHKPSLLYLSHDVKNKSEEEEREENKKMILKNNCVKKKRENTTTSGEKKKLINYYYYLLLLLFFFIMIIVALLNLIKKN